MNAIYVYYTYIMISWFQMGNMRHIQFETKRKEKWSKYKVNNDGRKRKIEKKNVQ